MRQHVTFILIISVFCSPIIASAYAGQIQSQQFSQEEAETMAAMEAETAPEIASIECGDEVQAALIVVLIVIGFVIAANV
jgi:Na+-transporting NADH:ubiquinone oxidoreductase subunit NqrC